MLVIKYFKFSLHRKECTILLLLFLVGSFAANATPCHLLDKGISSGTWSENSHDLVPSKVREEVETIMASTWDGYYPIFEAFFHKVFIKLRTSLETALSHFPPANRDRSSRSSRARLAAYARRTFHTFLRKQGFNNHTTVSQAFDSILDSSGSSKTTGHKKEDPKEVFYRVLGATFLGRLPAALEVVVELEKPLAGSPNRVFVKGWVNRHPERNFLATSGLDTAETNFEYLDLHEPSEDSRFDLSQRRIPWPQIKSIWFQFSDGRLANIQDNFRSSSNFGAEIFALLTKAMTEIGKGPKKHFGTYEVLPQAGGWALVKEKFVNELASLISSKYPDFANDGLRISNGTDQTSKPYFVLLLAPNVQFHRELFQGSERIPDIDTYYHRFQSFLSSDLGKVIVQESVRKIITGVWPAEMLIKDLPVDKLKESIESRQISEIEKQLGLPSGRGVLALKPLVRSLFLFVSGYEELWSAERHRPD